MTTWALTGASLLSTLHREMEDLERRRTTRLGGITVAGFGVLSAVVKVP